MFKATLAILTSLSLAGCSYELSEESLNQQISCVDTRDGEAFSFNSNAITNLVVDFSDACYDVVDDIGQKRNLCKSHELFLKCKEVEK